MKLFYKLIISGLLASTYLLPAYASLENNYSNEPVSPLLKAEVSNISTEKAEEIWNYLQVGHEKSICADRALVWSHQAYNEFNSESLKVFMHFSDAAVLVGFWNGTFKDDQNFNETRFWSSEIGEPFVDNFLLEPWIYHVAPVFNVNGKLKVFDKQFANRPVSIEEWNHFLLFQLNKILNDSKKLNEIKETIREGLKNGSMSGIRKLRLESALELIEKTKKEDGSYDVTCEPVEHLWDSDISKKSWCQIQFTSMYYWNQLDLLNLKNKSQTGMTGFVKTSFDEYLIENLLISIRTGKLLKDIFNKE